MLAEKTQITNTPLNKVLLNNILTPYKNDVYKYCLDDTLSKK